MQSESRSIIISSTSSWPVGFGFHPTDEELVNHFLRFKVLGSSDQQISNIPEVNLYEFEPWQLPAGTSEINLTAIQSSDPQCYFFSPRKCKYPKSKRAKRTTKAGYWKVTGKDRIVMARSTGEHIGTKKSLVYYKGRVPNGLKTNWVVHEYNPTFNFRDDKKDFVLCKLKKDPDDMPAFEEAESSSDVTSGFENQNLVATSDFANNIIVGEEEDYSDELQAQLESFLDFDQEGDDDNLINSILATI